MNQLPNSKQNTQPKINVEKSMVVNHDWLVKIPALLSYRLKHIARVPGSLTSN